MPGSSQAPRASLPHLQGSVPCFPPRQTLSQKCRRLPSPFSLQAGTCHVSQLFPVTCSSRGGSGECRTKQHVLSCPIRASLPAAPEEKRPSLHDIFPPFQHLPKQKRCHAEMHRPMRQARSPEGAWNPSALRMHVLTTKLWVFSLVIPLPHPTTPCRARAARHWFLFPVTRAQFPTSF